MALFSDLMSGQKLLPIIQADDPDTALRIATAMAKGGMTLVEVVFRSESAIKGLKKIKSELPEMTVGAGTIYSEEHLKSALNADTDFIVTPTISTNLLSQLCYSDVPILPGVCNSGQVLQAYEYGFRELKFFPASLSGGEKMLSALGAVFSDISFCPTGGINASNKNDYLSLENVFAVGGTWMAKQDWVENHQWEKITEACKNFLAS